MNGISTEVDQLGRHVARNIDEITILLPNYATLFKSQFLER